MPGVGGLPWCTPPDAEDKKTAGVTDDCLMLLSFGTRADAFYIGKQRYPDSEGIVNTEATGLSDIVIFGQPPLFLPADVLRFLVEEHNKWHGGATANAFQQMTWVHDSENDWLIEVEPDLSTYNLFLSENAKKHINRKL